MPELAAQLTEIAKALFYKERCYDSVLQRAALSGLAAAPLRDFTAWLPRGRIDQKRRDAEAMVGSIRVRLSALGQGAFPWQNHRKPCAVWQSAREEAFSANFRFRILGPPFPIRFF